MIETTRLILRPFEPQDWQALHEYLSDGEVVQFEPYLPFTEEESKREAIRRAIDSAFWAVCLRETGTLIGNLYFDEQAYGTWELGYVLSRRFQKMGYATEAATALIADAVQNRGARRIVAMCNPLNTASWNLLERLHFRREGHLRQNIYFKKDEAGNPIWADTYTYAILASEWHAYDEQHRLKSTVPPL